MYNISNSISRSYEPKATIKEVVIKKSSVSSATAEKMKDKQGLKNLNDYQFVVKTFDYDRDYRRLQFTLFNVSETALLQEIKLYGQDYYWNIGLITLKFRKIEKDQKEIPASTVLTDFSIKSLDLGRRIKFHLRFRKINKNPKGTLISPAFTASINTLVKNLESGCGIKFNLTFFDEYTTKNFSESKSLLSFLMKKYLFQERDLCLMNQFLETTQDELDLMKREAIIEEERIYQDRIQYLGEGYPFYML